MLQPTGGCREPTPGLGTLAKLATDGSDGGGCDPGSGRGSGIAREALTEFEIIDIDGCDPLDVELDIGTGIGGTGDIDRHRVE